MRLSNEKLAELSGVPKGTIDRLLSGEHLDFKFESIRPLIKVLSGGMWIEAPCPDEPTNFVDEKIVHLEEENEKLKKEIDICKEKTEIYKEELKWNRISSAILGALLAGCLVLITIALVTDHFHSDLGFFWTA